MGQVYKAQGYQVVATHWTLADGRVVSCHPVPGAPQTQTRYQAKKYAATLQRAHGIEWVKEHGVRVSNWRVF